MATYAIGDIQGCYLTLQKLLERIGYRSDADRLWLVGDLVNRGPRSLDVLRWARVQGDRVVAVLGNHDLHLLAVAAGKRKLKARDTLDEVLSAGDLPKLLEWVASRPLLYQEAGWVLVHAGLPPFWSLKEAGERALDLRAGLQTDREGTLEALYTGTTPCRDAEGLNDGARLRLTVAALTRMRACAPDGTLDLEFNGGLDQMPRGRRPWFEISTAPRTETVIFGHWAALGYHTGPGFVALDTGCVWGGVLTAYRLEDGAIFQVPNVD